MNVVAARESVRVIPIVTCAGTVNLDMLFQGRADTVKVDTRFRDFVEQLGGLFEVRRTEAKLYPTEGGSNRHLKSSFGVEQELDPNYLWMLLWHLSDEHFDLLTIPQGEEEVNIVLGYHDGIVFYVEHEFEDGAREIHLHARPEVQSWNDKPFIFVLETQR